MLDVDAIFKRYPTVCIIDELPFTNVAGSQHPKRYLEVHDLLLAGINVITAMNIQHLESLHDTVLRATGVDVRERVPDRFVLEADQIVNIDLTAEELRERLRAGENLSRRPRRRRAGKFFHGKKSERTARTGLARNRRRAGPAPAPRRQVAAGGQRKNRRFHQHQSRDDRKTVARGVAACGAVESRMDGGLCAPQERGPDAHPVGFAAEIHAERPVGDRTGRQRHGFGKSRMFAKRC